MQENFVPEKGEGENRSSIEKWIVAGIILLGVAAFFYFDLGRFLTLASLKENKEALRNYTENHYAFTVILFIVIYCVQTVLSLPGAGILSLAGGFLFGVWRGTIYVNLGATSGATLAFLVARYLFQDAVEQKFGKRVHAIQQGFSQNAFHYLLTLRLIPLFPFFLVNLACGLTRIRLSTYVTATAIGILPGSFVFTNAGKQLGTIESVRDIASPGVLGSFVLLGLLAIVPVIYKRFKKKSRPQPQSSMD
jgi:uncharacterized membrane protein YdjX (TVP38/TMEM64 family)